MGGVCQFALVLQLSGWYHDDPCISGDLRCPGVWKDFSFTAFVSCLWSISYIHTSLTPRYRYALQATNISSLCFTEKTLIFPLNGGDMFLSGSSYPGFPPENSFESARSWSFDFDHIFRCRKQELGRIGVGKLKKDWPFLFLRRGPWWGKVYIYIYFLVVLRQGSSCSSWYIHFFISRFKVVRKLVLSSRRSRSEASQAEVFEELLGLKHVEPIVGGVIRWWVPPDSLGGWVQWNGAGNIIL